MSIGIFICQVCQICGKLLCLDVPQIPQYQPKLILLTLSRYYLKKNLEYHLEQRYYDNYTVPKHFGQTHTTSIQSLTFLSKFFMIILEIFNNNFLETLREFILLNILPSVTVICKSWFIWATSSCFFSQVL